MRDTELLIPAGSLDVLKTAVIYGADAVYLGGEAFGLRAKAKNFTNEEIKEGIAFAHERGVKVYITANILAHNDDLAGVEQYFEELKDIRPDALIISDPGVFALQSACFRIWNCMSAPRQTIPTTEPICSGTSLAQSVWYPRESFPYRKSERSVPIFRRICRLRALSTEQCVFLIPAAAC